MRKSKATIKDLVWFDPDNYDFINNLTLSGLIEELECRCSLFEVLTDSDKPFDYEYKVQFEKIFSGEANIGVLSNAARDDGKKIKDINNQSPSVNKLHGDLLQLPSSEGVHPVFFMELAMYEYFAKEQGFIKWDRDFVYYKPGSRKASVTGNLKDCSGSSVLTSIDLDHATDDEIITSMTILLPLWRNELGIPEKEHLAPKKIGLRTIQKLVSNRVLQILDLLLWGQANCKEITNPVIAVLVFSDDPKDTQAIRDSVRPFAVEAMSDKYTRLLHLYVNKDTEISSCKLSEVMRRIL